MCYMNVIKYIENLCIQVTSGVLTKEQKKHSKILSFRNCAYCMAGGDAFSNLLILSYYDTCVKMTSSGSR